MKPAKQKFKKFKKETIYPHLRSEGVTIKRSNGATKMLIKEKTNDILFSLETQTTVKKPEA